MHKPDFQKLEDLRKHMMLTISDVTKLYGCSRTTYYGWIKGKPMRKSSIERVNVMVRYMLDVMVKYEWPNHEHRVMTPKARFAALLKLLKEVREASLKTSS